MYGLIRFQSTLPHGSDSINGLVSDSVTHFNPRSLTGATFAVLNKPIYSPPFQSTLPHGSDISAVYPYPPAQRYFNPRSLTGATPLAAIQISLPLISIHAPSRERLFKFPKKVKKYSYFNPRSLTGATICIKCLRRVYIISIHAPSRERPCNHSNIIKADIISIHAPSRERQHQNKILLHSFKSSIYCELAQFKSLKILF